MLSGDWVRLSVKCDKVTSIQFAFRAYLVDKIPIQELLIIRDGEDYRVIRRRYNICFLPEEEINYIQQETLRVKTLFEAMEKAGQKPLRMSTLIKQHLPYFKELYKGSEDKKQGGSNE